jgi:two-component system, OmpR family, phosphate regulon sensor histidine kinase PhoR
LDAGRRALNLDDNLSQSGMDDKTLNRDRSLIRSFAEAMPQAVIVIDRHDRIVAANSAAHAILPGLQTEIPLARTLRSPDVLDAIDRVRDAGRSQRVVWVEKFPVERLFEVNIAPLADDNFEQALFLSLHDLSDARRLERMRVDFVANASHELRTPLASLLGFVETLEGPAKEDAEARTRFLAIMREQAQRMSRLVDDLLSLSRIEQHLHVRPETPVDLVIEAPTEVVVPGDRDELLRVAENLIENAIKYGASDPATKDRRVVIELSDQGRQAHIAVRDFGTGIAPEHLPRLTERFYRVDAGQSRAKGGTGLGLAIVKHIIARHGGRLNIESKLKEGATFIVTLPLFES